MDKRTTWMMVLVAVGVGVGCGSKTTSGGGPCTVNTSAPCVCLDGAMSRQLCNASGAYDACQCGAPSGAGVTALTDGTTAGTAAGLTAGTGSELGGTAGTVGTTAGVGAGESAMAGDGALAGTGAAGSGSAGMVSTDGSEPTIPTITETCPTLATGMVTVLGKQVQLWVGPKQADKKGAVFFYWHGTGSMSSEASLLGGALSEIQAEGGIVASFTTTTGKGMTTGNNVWYTGDFEMADVILKCAIDQLNIDTHRIYTGGCSAGGLQAGAMLYGRSSYLAGVMPNSGGTVFPGTLQDPNHVPALITVHGTAANDKVGIEFATSSLNECKDVVAKGGFAVDCEHPKGHCQSPTEATAAQWAFLKAHPFGVSPEPYAGGLPSTFPSYCTIQ